jgi:hypothetical protein
MSLSRVETEGAGAHRLLFLLRYTQMATFRRRDYVTLGRTFYINIAGAIISPARASRIQSLTRLAVALAILAAWTTPAMADQQQGPFSFQVPKNDSAKAEGLANQLAALSPRVNRDEAKLLAECAYATVSKLRRDYRMFGTPIFNNFLIYHGLRKRGYCYQWTADLLVALDALKLKTLELHWGEVYAGTYRENNCLVATAKGQPFDHGMILECWRHMGHLRWNLVPSDEDRYVENKKYAQRVLGRSANANTPGSNHHVAFQKSSAAKTKAGD